MTKRTKRRRESSKSSKNWTGADRPAQSAHIQRAFPRLQRDVPRRDRAKGQAPFSYTSLCNNLHNTFMLRAHQSVCVCVCASV